jgi:AIPR protein
MSKYQTLLGILDRLREEAPATHKSYNPDRKNVELLNAARSRAYIHLYLIVRFGLLAFADREKFITDGKDDGGVDGYFIDTDHHIVYVIQSKFRTKEKTFEEKEIALEDLLAMEVRRIVDGKTTQANGNPYNGKIRAMQREIGKIKDIGRYDYKVVLLANLDQEKVVPDKLRRVVDGYDVEVVDCEKAYGELVFPMVAGTYYSAPDLQIKIDLTNTAAGSARVRYFVTTQFGKSEITLLFVPTSEIGRVLHKYRNSILKFNPRSFLGLKDNEVNEQIRATVEEQSTNEFALFNNGITLLSDSAVFNESTGQEGVAQVVVTNPQIINGGQTAYTLSQLYGDMQTRKLPPTIFDGKEVLLKIISTNTPSQDPGGHDGLKRLIEQVSRATNSQTRVDDADRRSNDRVQLELQKAFFDRYGLYYERKLGEFYDGLRDGYITEDRLIRRDTLMRISLACGRKAAQARAGIAKHFTEASFGKVALSLAHIGRYTYGLRCLWALQDFEGGSKDRYKILKYGQALRYGRLAVVSVCVNSTRAIEDSDRVRANVEGVLIRWKRFEKYARGRKHNVPYFDVDEGEANFPAYYKGKTIDIDLARYFKL